MSCLKAGVLLGLALCASGAHAQEGCSEAELEALIKPMIAAGQPAGTAFRSAVEDGANPATALSKVAPEPARARFERCQVVVEGVLEHLGYPPLH